MYVFFFVHLCLVVLRWPKLSGWCYVRTARASCVTREARVAQLQFSAIQATKSAALSASSPPRPDSRASTVYPSRTNTPPTSVYDSMHAPSVVSRRQGSAPRGRLLKQQDWPARVASPTPSVVSIAPTRGKDGWFE
jgi:hypothetical protein